jgi:hypothetical protein
MASFYRFRSAHALLDGYHELDEQVIHFAPSETLNDPMEGYKEVLWEGDAIAWRNLLNHYLLCLLEAFPTTLLYQKDHFEITGDNFIFKCRRDLSAPQYRAAYDEILRAFFAHEKIAALPGLLALRRYKIRRSELHYLLRAIHGTAFKQIGDTLRQYNMLPPVTEPAPPFDLDKHLGHLTRSLQAAGFDEPEKEEVALRATFEGMRHLNDQIDFISYSHLDRSTELALHALSRMFSDRYVEALDRLLYRDWAAACFVAEPNQAAMWGIYGDSHKGLCLKFKAAGGKLPHIMLKSINGWGGDKTGMRPSWGDVGFRFEEMKYVDKYPEIDFFRSMGVLPEQVLLREWYRDEQGQQSICAEDLLSNPSEWIQRHRQTHRDTITTKFRDWQHEREYRLVLDSHAASLDEIEHRKLKYKFEDLEGIIFGINTPIDVKLKVTRIIEKKCKENAREHFEFGQAWYSPFSGKVETRKLDLLKFT